VIAGLRPPQRQLVELDRRRGTGGCAQGHHDPFVRRSLN
jgi:hypothetical protein